MSRLSIGMAGRPNSLDEAVVRFTSAANRTLDRDTHAGRLLIVEAEFTNAAMTFTMPKAVGSGDTYKIVNNSVLTQSFVVAANGTDVLRGTAFVRSETAGSTDVFQTTATDDKYTFNVTTTGAPRTTRSTICRDSSTAWTPRDAFATGTVIDWTGTPVVSFLRGVIQLSGTLPPTITVQWAQNTAHASDASMGIGSYLMVQRL